MVNCVVSCDLYYEFVVIRCTQRRRVVVSVDAQNRDAYVKKSEEPPPRKKLKLLRHVIILFNVQISWFNVVVLNVLVYQYVVVCSGTNDVTKTQNNY